MLDPAIRLLIHNIGMSTSGAVAILLALFIFLNNPRRVANVTFALTMISTAVFIFSHVIGVSVTDPKLSQAILTLNVSVIFIGMFNTHCILSVLNKEKERRPVLVLIYVAGITLSLVYLLFPNTFLYESVPKMYFPNYYVPGTYHWIFRVLFNALVPLYFAGELAWAYWKNPDLTERNRYLYFAVASALGWGVGFTPIYLVYDIQIDPAFGSPFVFLYAIPFVYALVQYELMDIKVIAKKAFWYALAVIGTGSVMILLNLLTRWIDRSYPEFPFFVIPLLTAILVVITAIFIWRKLRENDLLKYEFITVATHKFRTPLTRINWAAESLLQDSLTADQKVRVENIRHANTKLVELTDLLVHVSEAEGSAYNYKYERADLSVVAGEVIHSFADEAKDKGVNLIDQLQGGLYASMDVSRIKFVMGVLVENAIEYTPAGQTVAISAYSYGRDVIFSVQDSGIGMSRGELALVFSKFYRGSTAKLADTEGVGVGLFMSKKIVSLHRGKIWAVSEGLNRGSVFAFSLPATK